VSIKEEGVGTRCNSGAPEEGSRAGGKDGGGVVCESFGDGRRGKRSGICTSLTPQLLADSNQRMSGGTNLYYGHIQSLSLLYQDLNKYSTTPHKKK
jgi:hypothetical protein